MYEAHWNLAEKPFENDQNVKFFYESKNHNQALVRILYATEQGKSLAVLVGECGSGKTYVCRRAKDELGKRGYKAALIVAPTSCASEFYRRASEGFGFSKGEGQGPVDTRHGFMAQLLAAKER